jgi:hypothetical protein
MQYQVLCNHNRHIVIVITQTPKLTQYLAIDTVGVTNLKMPTNAFQKEYDVPTKYSPKEAAGKFLSAAVRGYIFNAQAILNLKDIIMNDTSKVSPEDEALLAAASSPTDKQIATAEKKATAAAKVKAAKPITEAKPRGLGIGAYCKGLITEGKTNAEVLSAVLEKWPDAKTTAASLAWYRSELKQEAK